MELRGTHLILSVILSIVTWSVSWAAPKTPTKPSPAPTIKPKPLAIRKGAPVPIIPKLDASQGRGKYLVARPAGKPGHWTVQFAPQTKGLTLDATKTMLFSLEAQAGASVSPETVLKSQWNAKTQSFTLAYNPGKSKNPAEVRVRGAFTVCDSAKKSCQKVLEDFRFDPTLATTSGTTPPSAAKTRPAP